jgi:hypothetical protein
MMTRQSVLRYLAASGAATLLSAPLKISAQTSKSDAPAVSPNRPFPLQVDMRVPYAPTAFPSSGRSYLAYELYLTNFSGDILTIQRVELFDAEASMSEPMMAFEGEPLHAILQLAGVQSGAAHLVGPGATAVAFMWIESEKPLPSRLLHRFVFTDTAVDGAPIGTHNIGLAVLSPPVRGATWWASDGPGNAPGNHHRRGIFSVGGQIYNSRRFATDWFLRRDGKNVSGDVHDTRSYFAYGQPVFAVSDARVVAMRDGRPDNIPGPVQTFRTAIPNSMDSVAGNYITLDLGGGRYAWYLHLKPGSVRVRNGEVVRRGQLMGEIGCSGDSNLPHLHFEVTTSTQLMAGEGIPYVIDRFAILKDGARESRRRELPLDRMLIDFGKSTGAR